MFRTIKIRTNILLHFLFVLLTLTGVLIGLQYYFSQSIAKEAVTRNFHKDAHKIALTLKDKDTLSKEILYQLKNYPTIQMDVDDHIPMETVKLFIGTLKRYAQMYAIYMGYGSGDFFEVINMYVDKGLHRHYQAPAQTRWMVIKIYDTPQGRIRSFSFFDKNLRPLGSRQEPSSYHVTARPWYKEALLSTTPLRSDPYLFTNLQQVGITYATRVGKSQTVLALDFTLKAIHDSLRAMRFSKTGNIYLYGREGKLISTSETLKSDMAALLQTLLRQHKIDTIQTVHHQGNAYYAMLIPLTKELGEVTYVGITVSKEEILAPYTEKIYYALLIALLLLIAFIPVTLFLTDHIIKPIKALMQENKMIKQRRFDKVKPIQTNIIEFIELSNSQISMSQSIQAYQRKQEELLDSFIQLIADAIDAKSPYTGAHCKRVPVIAQMLADAAQESQDAPFKAFSFKDEDERTAFRRAAWLHDCGKITTPEFVVDKATKLETIHNRIHEIRTRFEVIWRDIEIRYYQRLLAGEEKSTLERWKEEEQQKLTEEFAFIAECNIGSEYMSEAQKRRVYTIAQRTWMRHFDDRLGLSENERKRYTQAAQALPVKELLISNRLEHLIERHPTQLNARENDNFKIKAPKYLYNRGELHNLCIEKGTLTPEERYKINEHVIMTIRLLERLPFPENMQNIPKIAGEHHESMHGGGYPKGLKQRELSIPSRIMAIADIFEALTASDRPYKNAKSLSEALWIMFHMKKEGQIDAALFNLFITSGIYRTYAEHFLDPAQHDEVDEAALLR